MQASPLAKHRKHARFLERAAGPHARIFPRSSIPTMLYLHTPRFRQKLIPLEDSFENWYRTLRVFSSSSAEKYTQAERLLDALTQDGPAIQSYTGIFKNIADHPVFFITSDGFVGSASTHGFGE
jgi:hypothetical protein